MLAASALTLTGVFAKPLGIPSDYEVLPFLASLVFFYFGFRASKKAKESGEVAPLPDAARRKRFWLMIGCCAVACAVMPFVLPVTGVTLPFATRVIICLVSFVLCIGAVWLGTRMRA